MLNLILSRSDNPDWEILPPQAWAALGKPVTVVDKEGHESLQRQDWCRVFRVELGTEKDTR